MVPHAALRRASTTPYASPYQRQEIDMPQTITTGYKALLAAAEREIETLSVEEARKLHGSAT
jgi:hypothetical protein